MGLLQCSTSNGILMFNFLSKVTGTVFSSVLTPLNGKGPHEHFLPVFSLNLTITLWHRYECPQFTDDVLSLTGGKIMSSKSYGYYYIFVYLYPGLFYTTTSKRWN